MSGRGGSAGLRRPRAAGSETEWAGARTAAGNAEGPAAPHSWGCVSPESPSPAPAPGDASPEVRLARKPRPSLAWSPGSPSYTHHDFL